MSVVLAVKRHTCVADDRGALIPLHAATAACTTGGIHIHTLLSTLLQADNERLVALLAEAKEWRSMAAELAVSDGLHYIPVQVRHGMHKHTLDIWICRVSNIEV